MGDNVGPPRGAPPTPPETPSPPLRRRSSRHHNRSGSGRVDLNPPVDVPTDIDVVPIVRIYPAVPGGNSGVHMMGNGLIGVPRITDGPYVVYNNEQVPNTTLM